MPFSRLSGGRGFKEESRGLLYALNFGEHLFHVLG
jgi:hypothetical protein